MAHIETNDDISDVDLSPGPTISDVPQGPPNKEEKRGRKKRHANTRFYTLLSLQEFLDYFKSKNPDVPPPSKESLQEFLNVFGYDRGEPLFRTERFKKANKENFLDAVYTTHQAFKPEASEAEGVTLKNATCKITSVPKSVSIHLDNPKRPLTPEQAKAFALVVLANPGMADGKTKHLSGTAQQKYAIFNAIKELNEGLPPEKQVVVEISNITASLSWLQSRGSLQWAFNREAKSQPHNKPSIEPKPEETNELKTDIQGLTDYLNNHEENPIEIADIKILDGGNQSSLKTYKTEIRHDAADGPVTTEVWFTKKDDEFVIVAAKRGDLTFRHETLKTDKPLFNVAPAASPSQAEGTSAPVTASASSEKVDFTMGSGKTSSLGSSSASKMTDEEKQKAKERAKAESERKFADAKKEIEGRVKTLENYLNSGVQKDYAIEHLTTIKGTNTPVQYAELRQNTKENTPIYFFKDDDGKLKIIGADFRNGEIYRHPDMKMEDRLFQLYGVINRHAGESNKKPIEVEKKPDATKATSLSSSPGFNGAASGTTQEKVIDFGRMQSPDGKPVFRMT